MEDRGSQRSLFPSSILDRRSSLLLRPLRPRRLGARIRASLLTEALRVWSAGRATLFGESWLAFEKCGKKFALRQDFRVRVLRVWRSKSAAPRQLRLRKPAVDCINRE